MVILAAALAGAAGYGVYKGGEAGVKQAKMTRKEMVRERQRKSQQTDLSCKQTNRKERIAQLVGLRVNANTKPTTSLSGASSGTSSWPLSRNSTTAASTASTTAATLPPTESNTKSSVDERLQNVMSKLKKEPEKPRGRLGKLFNKQGGSK
jgi:hypothetical protein